MSAEDSSQKGSHVSTIVTDQYANVDRQQLVILLKQTIKENKTLQNKNSKLQNKYVELFKQHKGLKKDHSVFTEFIRKFLAPKEVDKDGKNGLQLLAFLDNGYGGYEVDKLEALWGNWEKQYQIKLFELESMVAKTKQECKQKIVELQRQIEVMQASSRQKLQKQKQFEQLALQQALKKQSVTHQKELQTSKKSLAFQTQTISWLENSCNSLRGQLAAITKQKLKLEHNINELRKQQISEELEYVQRNNEHIERTNSQRNQFLSMRQQVEGLMSTRDELKWKVKHLEAELKEASRVRQLVAEQNNMLKLQLNVLKNDNETLRKDNLNLEAMTQKKNPLLNGHQDIHEDVPKYLQIRDSFEERKHQPAKDFKDGGNDSADPRLAIDSISREYMKNVFLSFIKTEVAGSLDKSLALLDIITTLLKFTANDMQAVSSYRSKKNQWWGLI